MLLSSCHQWLPTVPQARHTLIRVSRSYTACTSSSRTSWAEACVLQLVVLPYCIHTITNLVAS